MTGKKLILLMGGSGAGKTTIGEKLKELGIPETVSDTTREPRVGEINGVTYNFRTKEVFDKIDKLEETCYAGNHYCLSKQELENKWELSDVVFCIVDKDGVRQIREKLGNKVVKVIYISTDIETMSKRMKERGDKEEDIKKRINNSIKMKELENASLADYVVSNLGELSNTVELIHNYIKSL